ncbi:hypothetical protein ACMZKS_23040, partial [Citrobacter freundii]
SLKTSIKTITNLSDTNCLEIQGASLLNEIAYQFRVTLMTFLNLISRVYCLPEKSDARECAAPGALANNSSSMEK